MTRIVLRDSHRWSKDRTRGERKSAETVVTSMIRSRTQRTEATGGEVRDTGTIATLQEGVGTELDRGTLCFISNTLSIWTANRCEEGTGDLRTLELRSSTRPIITQHFPMTQIESISVDIVNNQSI